MSTKNPYKKGGMFEGAINITFEHAKLLRKNMTEAEKILWMHLKDGMHGYKFRRQHPISNYIVDFFCYKAKLIIELDGSVHSNEQVRKNDKQREDELQRMNYMIIRFSNEEVFYKLEAVLERVSEIVNNIIQNKAPILGV